MDYPGAREADAIVSYMKKCVARAPVGTSIDRRPGANAGAAPAPAPGPPGGADRQVSPALSTVTEEDLATFADSDKVVIIGFFAEAAGAEFEAFSALANANRDSFTFGYVIDADGSSAQEHGAKVPGVVLFKKFDERKNVFEGAFDAEELVAFIKANSVPLMDDIGPENYQSYAESGLPLAYLFVGSDEDRATHGPGIEAIAKDFKGKINFVYLDATKYGGHANNLNLKQQWPAFAIQKPLEGAKFPFDQSAEFTAEAIRKFVEDFDAGKIEPSLKSEDIPATQTEPVFTLVGKQFTEIVTSGKDVFLEIYAPWCGHCKKLAPVWEELATKLKPFSNIIVAKFDGTANDIPPQHGFQVMGFPTVKLFRADGEIVDYEGDRSLADLFQFVKTNAVNGASINVDVDGDAVEEDEKDEL